MYRESNTQEKLRQVYLRRRYLTPIITAIICEIHKAREKKYAFGTRWLGIT